MVFIHYLIMPLMTRRKELEDAGRDPKLSKIRRRTITKTMNTNYTLNWISCVENYYYYYYIMVIKGRFSRSLTKLTKNEGGLELPFNSFSLYFTEL